MESRQRHHLIRPGFTLVELIVVMALIGAIAAFTLPGFAESRQRAEISKESNEMLSLVREAQSRSMSASGGTSWKFVCHDSTVTIEPVGIPSMIVTHTLSSVTCPAVTVEFQKLTGRPTVPTTVQLVNHGGTVKNIIISATGTLSLH